MSPDAGRARWPPTWEARWIWAGRPPGVSFAFDDHAPPGPDTWFRSCWLRRGFDLEAVPDPVPARVTADSRFVLYLNGVEVARGPARSVPERLAWAEVDLCPGLRPGPNVLAAAVRFYGRPMPWWRPARPSLQLGYGSFAFEAPAIGVVSDRSWRAAEGRWRVAPSASFVHPPAEIVDGSELWWGWEEVDFDDSSWSAATELWTLFPGPGGGRLPVEPYPAPEPDGLAPLTRLPVGLSPVAETTVSAHDDEDPVRAYHSVASAWERDGNAAQVGGDADPERVAYAAYDAGRITLATPYFVTEGDAGGVVDVYAGEELDEAGRVVIEPRNYAFRYHLAGGGRPERVESFDAVGFRYLAVVARRGARVHEAGACERRYPRGDEAAFACDDDRLNRLWELGARTLDVCSSDAFIDCPGREQRAWVGDAYVHSLVSFVASADSRLVRRHLRICAHSQRGDGLLAMVAAGDASAVALTIPDYSLHWIRALARYHEHTGDTGTVLELLPTALEVADTFERHRGPTGLLHRLPGWVFVDWAQTERADVTAAVDALHAAALDDLASLLAHVGDEAGAARHRARADRTRHGFAALWDEDRGVYVDAADLVSGSRPASRPAINGDPGLARRHRVSQQTNAMAILGGCAPPERWPRMLGAILDPARVVVTHTPADQPGVVPWLVQAADPAASGATGRAFDPERDVVAAQPFFCHFLHQAVVRAGLADRIPELCLRWWPQVERGNTTFEEYWSAPPGTASRAHAWAATPTYDLTTHVLGVRPLAAGYQRAELRPRFGQSPRLHRLSGRVPTPHGVIEADLTPEGGTVSVPPGVTLTTVFEDARLESVELGPGHHGLTART